jgi:DNA-binding beta-propeller fold protein YncE
MVANDRDADLFVSFIDTKSYKFVKSVSFKGSDPNALNLHATGGIEQCQFDPRTGKIYLSLPEINGSGHGAVVVFDPKSMKATTFFPISAADCGAGPAGMAIGPNSQILIGCNAASPDGTFNTVIINENSGAIIARLANQGGSDEVWFNPGDGHYFLGETGNCGTCAPGTFAQLGVVDAVNHHVDQSVPTVDGAAGRAGSVAADPHTNKVFLPARADGVSTICSTLSGNPLDNAKGCIVVFTAKNDDRAHVGNQ